MNHQDQAMNESTSRANDTARRAKKGLLLALTLACLALAGCTKADSETAPPGQAASAASAAAQAAPQSEADFIKGMLAEVLASYRKTIVLFADEAPVAGADAQRIQELGHEIFHANLARSSAIQQRLFGLLSSTGNPSGPSPYDTISEVFDYVENDPTMFDADRLAFKELLRDLRDRLDQETTLGGARLRSRLDDDLRALEIIERNYDKELRGVYGRAGTRAIDLKRERWEDYVSKLKAIYTVEQLLKAAGSPQPSKAASAASSGTSSVDPDKRGQGKTALSDGKDIFGYSLPPKVVALTFDDGPHQRYTKDIVEILGQYGARATFFQVGSNLGTIDKEGQAQLGKGAQTARFLEAQGHAIANHSMTHAKLSALTGAPLKNEVLWADALLRKVDPARPPLFRFPYGARNHEAEQLLDQSGLKSIMWNVDSLDWADPIPSSIADRVLRSLEKEGRGIILFHDIHERTVKALPLIMSRLAGQGYQFAGWDGKNFSTGSGKKASTADAPPQEKDAEPINTADAWAVVVGIDEYSDPAWPKLKHAVADAKAFKEMLVTRFGYKPERIVTLFNKEATRPAILSALDGAQGASGGAKSKPLTSAMKPGDSLVFFYAGHGSTRRLSSGRDLGYIVPVDSTADLATDAIPMSELQNVSEGSVAKHAMFIMDACYSGLGLTRGAAGDQRAANFLRENAKRIGRQMLTAGGADQMVADGGPGGHSIFTWTLLQALQGKADFNNDGVITGTELAAYVAPAVSSLSSQTPAFGSLPGSEGGEFAFQAVAAPQYLDDSTPQMSSDAIALNKRIENTRSVPKAATAPSGVLDQAPGQPKDVTVVVKTLEGKSQTIVAAAAAAAPMSPDKQAEQFNERGMQLYKEANYAAAQEAFSQALKLKPQSAMAANNLGFMLHKQGKYETAIIWFKEALKIDPSRSVAYVNMADSQLKLSDVVGAKQSCQKYLDMAPAGISAGHCKEILAASAK